MSGRNSDFFNAEGYPDPTAYAVIRQENDLEKKCNLLIKVLKAVIELSGFKLLNRIELKDEKTGRVFK